MLLIDPDAPPAIRFPIDRAPRGNVLGLRVAFQTPCRFPAVNNGHFEVHQDDIGALGRRHLAPFLAVLGRENLEIPKTLKPHRLHDRWKPPIQLQEEQAIAVRELDPTAHLALKHNQLTSERGILSLKPTDRPERRNQQPQKEEEQRDHPGRRYVILLPDQTDDVFGTHSGEVAGFCRRRIIF